MLAHWSGVKKVGFWDYRYFIYCDDADWCLHSRRRGTGWCCRSTRWCITRRGITS